MTEKLKRCPFCNGFALLDYEEKPYRWFQKGFVARCSFCEVKTRAFPTEHEAAEMWNRRVEHDKV